jgi:hypothetical protein
MTVHLARFDRRQHLSLQSRPSTATAARDKQVNRLHVLFLTQMAGQLEAVAEERKR